MALVIACPNCGLNTSTRLGRCKHCNGDLMNTQNPLLSSRNNKPVFSMALITCPHCGVDTTSKQPTCYYCKKDLSFKPTPTPAKAPLPPAVPKPQEVANPSSNAQEQPKSPFDTLRTIFLIMLLAAVILSPILELLGALHEALSAPY